MALCGSCYGFGGALAAAALRFFTMGLGGVFASRSSRAFRKRVNLASRCSASSSTSLRTMRVVLSIGVSGLGLPALNTDVFVSFANGFLLDSLSVPVWAG